MVWNEIESKSKMKIDGTLAKNSHRAEIAVAMTQRKIDVPCCQSKEPPQANLQSATTSGFGNQPNTNISFTSFMHYV